MPRQLVDIAAVDWLTLTTYDNKTYSRIATQIRDMTKDIPVKKAQRMQYVGERTEQTFYGRGVQTGIEHYMMQCSGIAADNLFLRMYSLNANYEAKCTRIDVQITVERIPTDEPLSIIGRNIRQLLNPSGVRKGNQKKITIFDNGGQFGETCYIGSRDSESFIRLYDKEIGGRQFVRYEIEYKGTKAQQVLANALISTDMLKGYLIQEMAQWTGASTLTIRLREKLGEMVPAKAVSIRESVSDDKTITWLADVVGRTILRLGMSDRHQEVRALLKYWLTVIGE